MSKRRANPVTKKRSFYIKKKSIINITAFDRLGVCLSRDLQATEIKARTKRKKREREKKETVRMGRKSDK